MSSDKSNKAAQMIYYCNVAIEGYDANSGAGVAQIANTLAKFKAESSLYPSVIIPKMGFQLGLFIGELREPVGTCTLCKMTRELKQMLAKEAISYLRQIISKLSAQQHQTSPSYNNIRELMVVKKTK